MLTMLRTAAGQVRVHVIVLPPPLVQSSSQTEPPLEYVRRLLSRPPVSPVEDIFRPILAFKTNLLPWIGLNSLFQMKNTMSNLAAEYYFLDRWSVEANAMYAKWPTYSGDKFWGVCSYGVEPRFWIRRDGTFRGLYVGVFANAGEFDDQQDRNTGPDNRTGSFIAAGLSVGWLQPITDHLAV